MLYIPLSTWLPRLALLSLFSSIGSLEALEVIQAQVPPRRNYEGVSCQQTILQHAFAGSYGAPYVGELMRVFKLARVS
jgi:hypothetical protein